MFKKILIANRGEIALRVIQACRELGIPTVAVYSTADRDSLHVTYADEEVCIGPPPSAQSYLNISALISAAEITGADAIHPGYGFLSENAHFAEVLQECRLAWIGPPPASIRLMGDKARGAPGGASAPACRCSPAAASRSPTPRRRGAWPPRSATRSSSRRRRAAAAAACASCRPRRTSRPSSRPPARRPLKAFGDGSIYLEKYLVEPRHIEFQVFGDRHGNVIHLGERECSIQRRHQKLIEESPSPALDPELRERMGDAAVRLCRGGRLRERRHDRVPARRATAASTSWR